MSLAALKSPLLTLFTSSVTVWLLDRTLVLPAASTWRARKALLPEPCRLRPLSVQLPPALTVAVPIRLLVLLSYTYTVALASPVPLMLVTALVLLPVALPLPLVMLPPLLATAVMTGAATVVSTVTICGVERVPWLPALSITRAV